MEIDQLPTVQHQHPNPLPNPHHRKIELQSPLDLTYLQGNIAAAARQKLDLHFPPDAKTRVEDGGERLQDDAEDKEDAMRARVGALVNQFLERTFEFASHSISINGNDVPTPPQNLSSALPSTTSNSHVHIPDPKTPTSNTQPPPPPEAEREGIDFAYEAYDPRLSTKLASLYAELERETLAVSQLRRTAPAEGAKMVGEALLRSIEEEEQEARDHREHLRNGQEVQEGLRLDPLPGDWSEETAEMYERGLADLRRLGAGDTLLLRRTGQGGSLTETAGKLQRARDVAMELE